MEKLKKILASTKTTIILFIIILVLFLICKETVVYRFETLASYLYGTDADNKGKLLSTILTAIGGVCVIWGLWLNNKKVNQQIRQVNEQVRQNDIAIQNSNDKRFCIFFLVGIKFQHLLLKFSLFIQDNLLDIFSIRAVGLRFISCKIPITG